MLTEIFWAWVSVLLEMALKLMSPYLCYYWCGMNMIFFKASNFFFLQQFFALFLFSNYRYILYFVRFVTWIERVINPSTFYNFVVCYPCTTVLLKSYFALYIAHSHFRRVMPNLVYMCSNRVLDKMRTTTVAVTFWVVERL